MSREGTIWISVPGQTEDLYSAVVSAVAAIRGGLAKVKVEAHGWEELGFSDIPGAHGWTVRAERCGVALDAIHVYIVPISEHDRRVLEEDR